MTKIYLNNEQEDSNVYVNNSSYLEFISEIAHDLMYVTLGDCCWKDKNAEVLEYTEIAQDLFTKKYEEVEHSLNTTLKVYSDIDKINNEEMETSSQNTQKNGKIL